MWSFILIDNAFCFLKIKHLQKAVSVAPPPSYRRYIPKIKARKLLTTSKQAFLPLWHHDDVVQHFVCLFIVGSFPFGCVFYNAI